jgi:hypothetical protein
VHIGFWWKILIKILRNLGVDGNIILKCIFKKWNGEAWTKYGLAQGRDRWPALVNAVMILRVS